jgi:uncharacterized protein related to proFAR isomerase
MQTFTPSAVSVLDWYDGGLVHAHAGQRQAYQPLFTTFPRFVSRSPKNLVRELRERLGVTHFYLADLDALQGRRETGATDLALEIMGDGLTLWWDRGLGCTLGSGSDHPQRFSFSGAQCHPVLGTESCRSPADLFALLAPGGVRPWTLSLDLIRRNGGWSWFGHEDRSDQTDRSDRSDQNERSWGAMPLVEVVERSVQLGVRQLIVLNLADVGSNETSTGPILRELRRDFPTVSLMAGGGVRDNAAFRRIVDHGADYVLTGTWLWTQLSEALPWHAAPRS